MSQDPRIEVIGRAIFLAHPLSNDSMVDACWDLYEKEAAAAVAAIDKAETIEYGITWSTNDGTLRTEWGYGKRPELDADEEFQVGKREWVHVLEILARPTVTETSIWQSEDCAWKDPR